MYWALKVFCLGLMGLLVMAWRKWFQTRVHSGIQNLVPKILILGTWIVLVCQARSNWLSDRWGLELDPVRETGLARVGLMLLILYVIVSIVVAVWKVRFWLGVDPTGFSVARMNFYSVGHPELRSRAKALALVQERLGGAISVVMSEATPFPYLAGLRRKALVAHVPSAALDNPEKVVQALNAELRSKRYLWRFLNAVLTAPLSLAMLGSQLINQSTSRPPFSTFRHVLVGAVILPFALLVWASLVLPGKGTFESLRAGTSRTNLSGWQVLNTDKNSRIWTTNRGGTIRGLKLTGVIVDTRESTVSTVRLNSNNQRVRGRDALSYTFVARVRGNGTVPPIVRSLALGVQSFKSFGDYQHRTFNEQEFKVMVLQPGKHTYHVTHRGMGPMMSDSHLQIPPGWVVELSDMAEANPESESTSQSRDEAREIWKKWKVATESSGYSSPRANLDWTLAKGVRR
jgi:hypothetical protein